MGFQPNYAIYPFYPGYAPHYLSINDVATNLYIYQPPKPVVPPTPAMNIAFATQPPRNNQPRNRNDNRAPRLRPQFDPILITYIELFPQLVASHLIALVRLPPLKSPYPK